MVSIRQGMQAKVELRTGSKTVLQYLRKPFCKSREPFRQPWVWERLELKLSLKLELWPIW